MYNVSNLSQSVHELQAVPQHSEQIGSRFCERMKQLVGAALILKNLAEVSCNHGTRMMTAGVTIATGISYITSGSLVSGGAMTLVGLKEAANIWSKLNQQNDVARLLDDANAGVDMIETLEEANTESFKVVNSNLESIGKNVKKMNDRMQKIKHLASHGHKEIEEIKGSAIALYDDAHDQFNEAQANFNLAQSRFKQASKLFVKALKELNELFDLAQKAEISNKEKVEKFVKIAQRIHQQCLAAQTVLKEGNEYLRKGLTSLDLALEKEQDAYGEAVRAMTLAEKQFELIETQAKFKREYEGKVKDTQDELKDIQDRHADVKALLDELSDDLKKAKEANNEQFGTFSVIFGAVPGAVMGYGMGGPLTAAAGGYFGAEAVHRRGAIFNKVDTLINGAVNYVKSGLAGRVTVKFQDRSTGWFNRFIRKETQSWTAGVVDIQIGKEQLSLNFNLNQDSQISKTDLFDLQKRLAKNVISGDITPQECLHIIEELETKHIDRGTKHKAQTGIIPSNSVYFNELKRICRRMATEVVSSS